MRNTDRRTDRYKRRHRRDGSIVLDAAERARRHADHDSCETGKLGYRTKRKAIVVLEHLRNTARKDYREMSFSQRTEHHPYECETCGYWHLTSQRPRAKAA